MRFNVLMLTGDGLPLRVVNFVAGGRYANGNKQTKNTFLV